MTGENARRQLEENYLDINDWKEMTPNYRSVFLFFHIYDILEQIRICEKIRL